MRTLANKKWRPKGQQRRFKPASSVKAAPAAPHVLPDVAEIMRENAALRRENARLRGELAVMASKVQGMGDADPR